MANMHDGGLPIGALERVSLETSFYSYFIGYNKRTMAAVERT